MYIKPIDTETTLLRDKNRRLEAQHARDKEKMAQDAERIAQLENVIRAMGAEPPAPQMP